MACEFWLHGFPVPGRAAQLGIDAEAWGLDGLLLADSQLLVGDPYVELTLVAKATSRLRLGPGVTNPITRHPSVTAALLATLQLESDGRAVAVLGRGDSAVRQIGVEPADTATLSRACVDLRTYLSGGAVPAAPGLAGTLGWYPAADQPRVPVVVAATGPTTIRLGARHADGVDLTVGAEPERIAWGLAIARGVAADQGRSASVGAWVNVAVHPDPDVARDLVRGSAAIFAHFVSEGPLDVLSGTDRAAIAPLSRRYVERDHGLSGAAHTAVLSPDFIDRFTVAGTPDQVAHRLRELVDLGLDRMVLVPASRDSDPALVAQSNDLLARHVLPYLRGRRPRPGT